MNFFRLFLHCLFIFALICGKTEAQNNFTYGIAMHGQPKFSSPQDIKFDYVNTLAPKGGKFSQNYIGTFDSLNPYIIKGTASTFIRGFVVESLMTRALDEPFTLYGLIASSISVPEDKSEIIFKINELAQFSDKTAITAQDVKASFEFLKTKGRPNFRSSFQKVESVDIIDPLTIKFSFPNAKDRELPLILGLMPLLPKVLIDSKQLESTTLTPFIGSGPYIITDVNQGQMLVLKRNPDYWGKNLKVQQGLYNFDEMRIEYYRDSNAAFEAFKAGRIDFRVEEDATRWTKAYDFEAIRIGTVRKKEIYSGTPKPMQGFVYNTRRPPFDDINVRQGVSALFNFEWINANLYGNAYTRTTSYFEGSMLSALHTSASPHENSLLPKILDKLIPESILNGTYKAPKLSSSGRDRDATASALGFFTKADYSIKDHKLVNTKTGEPLSFEITIVSKEQEKNALAFQTMLKQFGINAQVRLVDSAQFERRRQNFEFDMIPFTYPSSLSPGNEQIFRWASKNANIKGSFNLAGVQSEFVDEAIQSMLNAQDHAKFVESVRALDRLLMAGHYMLPLYHAKGQWIAHWEHIGMPEKYPLLGFAPEVMWMK